MTKWFITFVPEIAQARALDRAVMDASIEESTWEPLYDEVEADSLEVHGGALVFFSGGQVDRVYSSGTYFTVQRQDA